MTVKKTSIQRMKCKLWYAVLYAHTDITAAYEW